VFLYDDASRAEIDSLQEKLAAMPHVKGVEFCSKKCAVEELERRLEGDLKGSISELNSNPLPKSFNLDLDDPDNLEAVRAALMPPNSAGKPTPISPAIDPPVGDSRQDAKEIREVTG